MIEEIYLLKHIQSNAVDNVCTDSLCKKVSVFRVILVQMQQNADQNNSEYGPLFTQWNCLLSQAKLSSLDVVLCPIWYHMYDLKNVKNTHGGVLLLVSFKLLACNFAKSNTPPWGFLLFVNCVNDTKSRNTSHMMFLIIFCYLKYYSDST